LTFQSSHHDVADLDQFELSGDRDQVSASKWLYVEVNDHH
jgi:hypothetical protein